MAIIVLLLPSQITTVLYFLGHGLVSLVAAEFLHDWMYYITQILDKW